jgi:hypothetical protein
MAALMISARHRPCEAAYVFESSDSLMFSPPVCFFEDLGESKSGFYWCFYAYR